MSGLTVTVDYDAIRHNVEVLRSHAGQAAVMAVVKADAYGHGLVDSARAARRGGADWLGVAQPHEALALRESGDSGRLLAWLYGPEVAARELVERDVDLTVASPQVLAVVAAAGRDVGRPARVHLCVDTGLGREGASAAGVERVMTELVAARDRGDVEVVGLWSHFALADQPGHPAIATQVQRFEEVTAQAAALGLEFPLRHLANSAATLTRPELAYDMVRPGIAVYGLPPIADPQGGDFGLRPAMSVTTELALVKRVSPRHGVSYGFEYVTDRETTLGLVPVGYADGVFRSAGNRAQVRIGGRLHRIAGRVCMDQFVVDLGPDATEQAGDSVVLIGADGPTARDWAEAAGTIDYEVVCRFGGLRPKAGA